MSPRKKKKQKRIHETPRLAHYSLFFRSHHAIASFLTWREMKLRYVLSPLVFILFPASLSPRLPLYLHLFFSSCISSMHASDAGFIQSFFSLFLSFLRTLNKSSTAAILQSARRAYSTSWLPRHCECPTYAILMDPASRGKTNRGFSFS